jgi:hypothetical protein
MAAMVIGLFIATSTESAAKRRAHLMALGVARLSAINNRETVQAQFFVTVRLRAQ